MTLRAAAICGVTKMEGGRVMERAAGIGAVIAGFCQAWCLRSIRPLEQVASGKACLESLERQPAQLRSELDNSGAAMPPRPPQPCQ